MLLLARHLKVEKADSHLAIAKWLIETAGVLIDGRDLSGTTALSHSISTKPSFDPALAELLVGASGDVNAQNRYGGTAGHEICTAYEDKKASKALGWFLSHGGNVDIRDGDGATARLGVTAGPWRGLKDVLKNEDWRRKRAERFARSAVVTTWNLCCAQRGAGRLVTAPRDAVRRETKLITRRRVKPSDTDCLTARIIICVGLGVQLEVVWSRTLDTETAQAV